MGMLDRECIFSEAQAVTALGDTPSTNIYDTGAPYNNSQDSENALSGENLWIQVFVNSQVAGAGSSTAAVFQSSPDNLTWTDVLSGSLYPPAQLTAGTNIMQVQPPTGTQRYWRIVYRVSGAALTGGKFDAYLSNTIQRNVPRPSGIPPVG
jgi:hypothetical protein